MTSASAASPSASWDQLRLGQPQRWARHQIVPFGVFLGMLLALQIMDAALQSNLPSDPWWRKAPEQLVYPLQTLLCLGLVIKWWRSYEFRWSSRWVLAGALFGAFGIGLWLLPTELHDKLRLDDQGWWKWLGVVDRRGGFDPGAVFLEGGAAWWTAMILRFLRAVVVVALVEEIFWRSFLMRFVDDWEGDYWRAAFGTFSWRSYLLVTGAFMLAHHPSDYAGAWVYGSLTYWLCVWSKSLGACVVMHAVANGLLGWYIMQTGKTGLW